MSIYRFVLLLFILFSNLAPAQFPVAAFWQQTNPYLKFLTLPQSLASYNCSGVVTVQASDSAGAAVNVNPNLTVNLTGTSGVTYYSDSACSTPVTDVTITMGTSTQNFYFTSETLGLVDVVASATGYDSAVQTETITANQFIWIGAGGNANWSTGANWLGGVAPGASDTAIFNDYCVSNCSPNITSNISVKGVKIFSPFAGTITQTAAFTMTFGSEGWFQESGTFVGGTGSVTMTGHFNLSGGSYTATSNTTNITRDWKITGSATFDPNVGTVDFGGPTIIPGSGSYHNVIFGGWTVDHTLNGTMTVAGTTTLSDSGNGSINTGTIIAQGNVVSATNGKTGSALIKITGNSTITGVSGARIPKLEIDAGANTVNLVGTVEVTHDYTYTSGVFNAGTSTLRLSKQWAGTFIPGNVNYNNLDVGGYSSTANLSGGTFNVLGNLNLTPSSALQSATYNNGTFIVHGNFSTTAGTINGTANIQFAGSNSQSITIGSTGVPQGTWTINKPSGTVTQLSNLTLNGAGQDLTIASGVLDMNTFSLTVSNSSGVDNVLTINSGATLIKGCATLTYETLINNGTLNDGTTPPNITIADLSSIESSGGTKNFDFTVSLSAPYCSGSVTVKYATAGDTAISGTDFTAVAATTLTFAAGETTKTATVVVTGDTIPEVTETFFVNLTLPTNGVITDAQAIGTIEDDDPGIAWTGATGNGLWSDPLNWAPNTVPISTTYAVFSPDNCTGANCNSTINVAANTKGVLIKPGYTGTITQSGTNTVTIGTDGWTQSAGTFVGGSGAMTISTYLIVSGGSFTATSGLLNLASPRRITLANSTFTHNGGNAELSGGISSTTPGVFDTGNNSFNNMTLTFNSHARFSTVGSMKVDGNLSTNFNVPSTDLYFTSGTIELKGNLNLGGTTPRGLWGDGFVKLVGNPSGQTITGIANSRWSSIEIDAGVHPVTLSGTVAIHRSFIMTSVGTFTTTGSTLQFSVQYDVGGTTATMNPGNAEYNNVTLDSTHSGGRSYNLLSNFKIKGDLILAGNHSGHNILGNKLIVEGNVTMSNTTADNSTAVLEFAGTNNQVVTTNTVRGYRGAWVVNKPSGKVTLVNNLVLDGASQDLTIQSGTLDQNGYALTVSNSSGVDNVLTINSGATLIKGCATLTYETLVNNGTIDSGTNPPNISIADLSTTESSGGTKNFDFTVSLSAPYCAGSVTVKYATAGDTAISGTDFTAVAATTLTFAAGETTKTATVVVTGDTIPEINETFFVDLTLPTNGVITDAQAIGTIVDDDPGIAWTGATGNGLWNDTGNWSPNTVPTITTYAVFSNDNCSGANCNATINAAAAAKGVVLLAGYNGTITQSGTNTLTIGADGWAQASGTFVGGSGNITINNDSGSFYLTGGSFTSTSGTLEVRKDFVLSAAGTFLHNNGTLRHYTTTSSTMSRFKTDGHSLYHYIHSRDWVAHSALESDVTVLGNLTISNTHNQGGYWRNAFNIFVHGNISAGQYWNSGQTPNIAITLPTIHLVGTSNQTINGTAVYSGIQLTTYLPNLTINKPSGTAYLTGEFGIYHSLKRVSGTVDATAATLHWGSNGGPGGMGTRQFDSNGMSITNFFIRWKSVDTIVMNGDLTINSDLTIGGHFNMGTASGGNLRVKGNVLFTEPGSTLSTHIFNIPITFEGTGNQTIANTGSTNIRADITVNKPSGSVIQNSAIILDRASNDLTIQAGTWNQNGYALTVSNSSGVDNVLTIASGATLIKGCATLTYETLVNNGTLNDGTNPPTISIADASIAEGNTGSTNLNFTVSLSAPYCSGAVTMNYATADDSALGGIDFTSIASTALSFAAGESSKTVTVALTGDTIPEINETFFVNLTSPTNATIADAQAIGTITNDDVGVAWTGATGNGQWNNTGNWSPNTVPTSSLYAVFDPGSCSGANCNVTINANATAKGVLIQPGFTGTITQSSTFTVTVGTDGWSQNAGTFVGGSGNFSNNGRFTLSGGSFTATTGTTNSGRGFIVSNSSTFTHNNGTVYIYMQDYTVPKAGEIIVPDNLNFNNLTIGSNGNGTYSSFGLIGKPIILGNFILNLASNGTTSGEITAQSNVTFQNNFAGSGTGFKINLTGSNNQSITGNSGTAASSSGNAFVINKPAGTVTFYDRVVLRGEFTHVAGTVNFDPASTIQVGLSTTMDAQNLVFNHLTTSSGTGGQTLTIVNQLVVDGTLTLNYTTGNKLTGGTLFARGNIIGTAVNGYSTTLLKISGSANQLITGPAINMNTEIDKSGGTATFTGDYFIGQTAGYNYSFLYTAGNVVFDVTSRMVFAQGAHTINSGALEFNNVSFPGTSASTYTTTGSIKVNGLLTKSSSGFFFGGTLEAYGNISSTTGCPISNGANPRTQLKIMGAANQTIDNTTGPCLPVEIAKTGGTATFSNNLRVAGDFLYTSGTAVFDSTSSVQFGESWNLAANNLNTGSLIFNDVEFLNRANFAITGTLKVARDVKFQLNQDYEYINGGTIEVGRNLNAQHVSSGGTTDITFNGSGDQTYSWTYGTVPGNWSINKPSGKVLLANNLALKAGATMVINSGNTLEMSGNNLTAPGGITNNGTLERGPTTCGTISGTVTGNAAICTP